jgi:hypothetical protein
VRPQGAQCLVFLYDDFDLPSELDDDPERECKTAEREGSEPRVAHVDSEAGPRTSAAKEGAERSGTNADPHAREPWQEIAELKQQMAALQKQMDDRPPSRVPTARPQVRISPKDIALVKFSGNDNMDAHFMSPDKYLPLLEWLHSAEFTLCTSRLDATHHVSVLLQHLVGAAKRMFLKKYGHRLHELQTWTLDEAKLAIASLVPEHRTLFTKAAMKMTFTAKELANNVETFATYVQNGELHVEGNRLIFDQLQEKIVGSMPKHFHNLRHHSLINNVSLITRLIVLLPQRTILFKCSKCMAS